MSAAAASQLVVWQARLLLGADMRTRLYEKLARLLDNGVALHDALRILQRRARRPGGALPAMLQAWQQAVEEGLPLQSALAGWVAGSERMLIAAGERSGFLPEALRGAVTMIRGNREIARAVRRAVALPAFYLLLMFVLAALASVTIVPVFATALPRERWTGSAAWFAAFGDLMRQYGVLLGVVASITVVVFAWSLPRWTGPLRRRLDRWPPYSLYRFWAGTGFLLGLAALVRGAVSVEEALETLRVDSGAWMRERLDAIHLQIHAGQDLGPAMELAGYGFPDEQIIDDMCIYGVLGGFDDALQKTAEDWRHDAVSQVQDRAAVLHQLAMLLAGAMLLWLAWSLFDLILQVTDQAARPGGG